MKGINGVSMQGIEYRTPAKGNHMCKDCKHLVANHVKIAKQTDKPTKKKKKAKGEPKPPYKCEVKNKERYYTTRCYCNHFEPKQEDQALSKLDEIMKRRLDR